MKKAALILIYPNSFATAAPNIFVYKKFDKCFFAEIPPKRITKAADNSAAYAFTEI